MSTDNTRKNILPNPSNLLTDTMSDTSLGINIVKSMLGNRQPSNGVRVIEKQDYYSFLGVRVPIIDFSQQYSSIYDMSESLNRQYAIFESALTQAGISVTETVRADKIKAFISAQAADWYRNLYPYQTAIAIDEDEISRWIFERLLININTNSSTERRLVGDLIKLYKQEQPYRDYSQEQALQNCHSIIDDIYNTQGGQILNVELRKSFRHIIKNSINAIYRDSNDRQTQIHIGRVIVTQFIDNTIFSTISRIFSEVSEKYSAFKTDLTEQGLSASTISNDSAKIFVEGQTKLWLRLYHREVYLSRLSPIEKWQMRYLWLSKMLLAKLSANDSPEQTLVIKLCALAEKRGQYQDHSLKNSLIELDDIMQKMYVKRDLGDDLAGYFQQILVEVITPRFTRAEINSALNEA